MKPHVRSILVIALVLGGWLASAAVGQGSNSASGPAHQQFLFAYKLLQRGEDAQAAEAFDEYLRDFPHAAKAGDGAYYRATLYRRAHQPKKAAELLKGAAKPKLVPNYALPLLHGQVLYGSGRAKEAVKPLESIDLSTLKPSRAASIRYLLGRVYRDSGNLDAAAKALEGATQTASALKPRALIDLAGVRRRMDQPDKALAALQSAQQLPEPAIAAWAAQLAGEIHFEQGHYSQAIEAYQRVIDGHAESRHFEPALVGCMWAQYESKQNAQVVSTFNQHGKQLTGPHRLRGLYLLGSAQQRLDKHEKASAAFKKIVQTQTDDKAATDARKALLDRTLYKLARSRFELGRYDPMRQALGQLFEQYPDSDMQVDSAFLLAAAQAEQGNVSKGADLLGKLIGDDQAKAKSHPYHTQALLRRARLYENHGQPQAAIPDYQRYLKTAKSSDAAWSGAMLSLIDLHFGQQQFEAAQARAEQLLAQNDLKAEPRREAMYRRALALMKQDKAKAALAQLNELNKRYPLHPYKDQAGYYRGLLLVSQDKPNQAAAALSDAAQKDSLSKSMRTSALHVLSSTQREQGRNEAGAKRLEQLEELAGDLEALTDSELLWLGRYKIDRGQSKAATRYLQILVDRGDSVDQSVRVKARYELGRAYRRTGSYAKALEALGGVLAQSGGQTSLSSRARFEMAMTQADQGNLDQALGQLRGLLSIDQSQLAARAHFQAGQINRRMAQQRADINDQAGAKHANQRAHKLFKRLVILFPFEKVQPLPQQAYVSMGETAAAMGDADLRQRDLKELIETYPDGPYAAYAKAMLAKMRGRLGEARQRLNSLEKKQVDAFLAKRLDQRQ